MCESQSVSSSHFLIRSSDRNSFWDTTPANFNINLQKSLKGRKAQISYLQMPVTYYNVNSSNNTFTANIVDAPETIINVTPGSYNISDIINYLQGALSFLGTVTVTLNPITFLFTISCNNIFYLNFNVNNSIAEVLGFNPNLIYGGQLSYTAQKAPKLFDNAIYISCNFATAIQTTTKKLHNVSFVIPHNCNKGEIIQFYASTQFSLQPRIFEQTIGIIEIKVFDERGRQLENLGEWVMMLEII